MNEKIDNYYKKIYLFSKEYHNNKNINNKKDLIEFDIDFLIDTNREHYLTDSFLNYLSSLENVLNYFYYLTCGTTEEQIYQLFGYFQTIFTDIDRNINSTRRQLQDYNTSLSIQHALDLLKYIHNTEDGIIFENKRCFKNIIYIVLSYCFIKNRIDDFSSIICKYIQEPNLVIDDMVLNGIRIDELNESFIKRIVSVIEENKKLIK